MSVENLKEYARRCAEEPELRAKARAIGTEDMEKHQRHAASLGLDWTIDDMAAFRKEMIEAADDLGDLSEEDLEQVAGGFVTTTVAVAVAVSAAVAGAIIVGVGVVGTAAAGGAAAAGNGGW